jgi:hypothetical protein
MYYIATMNVLHAAAPRSAFSTGTSTGRQLRLRRTKAACRAVLLALLFAVLPAAAFAAGATSPVQSSGTGATDMTGEDTAVPAGYRGSYYTFALGFTGSGNEAEVLRKLDEAARHDEPVLLFAVTPAADTAGSLLAVPITPEISLLGDSSGAQDLTTFSAETYGNARATLYYSDAPDWAIRSQIATDVVPVPAGDDAQRMALEMQGVRAGIYMDWSPTERLQLSFGPEYGTARNIPLLGNPNPAEAEHGAGARFHFRWNF